MKTLLAITFTALLCINLGFILIALKSPWAILNVVAAVFCAAFLGTLIHE